MADRQVLQHADLGNGVVDTMTFSPFVSVKNGQMVHLFTDGFVDLSNVTSLKFPDSRFAFAVKVYEKDPQELLEAIPDKVFVIAAGRTELEINETSVAYMEATLLVKENL